MIMRACCRLVVLGVTFSASVAVGAGPETATVFRHDFSRCGYDGGAVPARLTPAWTYQEEFVLFLSSPAVVGDRVYGAGCLLDVVGTYGSIFCLDVKTGKPIWAVEEIGNEELKGVFSSPSITADGKYLVIGEGLHNDKDSHLICLDARTGRLHWRIKTSLHIEGSPAIFGDMVVAGAGAIEDAESDHKPVGNPGFVIAVRITDGKELWRYSVADPESSPAISPDGIVYIGSGYHGNAVVALRSETDEQLRRRGLDRLLWKTPTPSPATSPITLTDELVIMGCGRGGYASSDRDPSGVVMALDRRLGTVRWKTQMDDVVLGPLAANKRMVVCPAGRGGIVALDLRNGKVLWKQRDVLRSPVMAGPALAGRYVYAVSNDGYLAVLHAAHGGVHEKHYLNDKDQPGELRLSVSSPTVVGGRVYVGSETGGLRCFTGTVSERKGCEQ